MFSGKKGAVETFFFMLECEIGASSKTGKFVIEVIFRCLGKKVVHHTDAIELLH